MARDRMRASPGGAGGGLPALSDGEPLLQRWFVIPMLVLVVLGLVVTAWMAATLLRRPSITVAERRPPGTAEVTHDRGQAILNDTTETSPGPGCASGIEVFGDQGARDTATAALEAVCGLLDTGNFPDAEAGIQRWRASGGQLRVAVFELTGVEATSRVETFPDGPGQRIVIELNPRFQFERAFRAGPMVLHELVHIGASWPGQAVTAEQELAAMRVQHEACELMTFTSEPPRGCLDAALLVDDPEGLGDLRDAGYGPAASPSPSQDRS